MKNIATYLCLLGSLILTSTFLFGKSSFVSQIPNGSENSCATCHTSNSNYSLNSFGSASPCDAGKVSNPGVKASIPTSVKNEYNSTSLSFYPNPATDFITISIPENIFSNYTLKGVVEKVQIFNTLGIEVLSVVAIQELPLP